MRCTNCWESFLYSLFYAYVIGSFTYVEILLIIVFPWRSDYCRVFEEGILSTVLEYSLRGIL